MRARLADFTMEYDEAGSGRPVLFMHGYPLNRTIWQDQLAGLVDAGHLLAPDLRGHGRSDSMPGPYAMDLFAEDCRQLLDQLEITEPVVVCGLSMGGYITLAFQRLFPERVAALILVSTRAGADSPEGRAGREQAMNTAKEKGLGALFDTTLPKLVSPQTAEARPELLDRVGGIMATVSLDGVLGDLAGMRDRPDARPQLGDIHCPVLVLHGADDQLIPPLEAEATHSAIPGSHLRIIEGAGHLPCMEKPEEFNQEVREFLGSF